jgi:hypothetical protein
MIVVGMAGLVMAISIPFVQRTIRRDAVYQAVRVVEDACHSARAVAIFNNAPCDLVIRPHEKAFRVQPAAAAPRLPSREGEGELEAPAAEEPPERGRIGGRAAKPFSGALGEDVAIELLDVNFIEYRDEEETRVRFHPNGTSDEFTIVMRIGASAWRKITLDLVTGLPTLEVIR